MARVFLVDDDPGTLESFARTLRIAGHDVETAQSGAQALQTVHPKPPDVCLFDLKLPDMTGLELIGELRTRGLTAPIIIVTGFGTVASAVEALKLGVLDYLEKPLDIDDVLRTVERACMDPGGPQRAPARADGLARWAIAVARVLGSPHDPRTVEAWSALVGVAPDTLRGWCRTADLSPKSSLDLARVLRATYHARRRHAPPEVFLDVADRRTLERLQVAGGLGAAATCSVVDEVLRRQTLITDPTALEELRHVLHDLGLDL